MKTIKLKNFCFSILICILVVNAMAISLVHAAHTIPGVQRLEEGVVAYERGEYDDAIFKLEMAVYQIPEEDKDQLWVAYFYLGVSYLLTGDNDEMRIQFIKATEMFKNRLPGSDIYSPKIVKLFKEVLKPGQEDIIGAAKTGNVKFLDKLLKSGVNPNITDKKGWFSLVYAVLGGHEEAVKLLLSDGASVNMRTPDGSTALMVAVSNGNESIVRVLRRRKAHKYIRNNEGKTALIFARQKGHLGIEKLLDSSRNKVEGVFTDEECILCHSITSIKDFVKFFERGVHGPLQRGYKDVKCITCHESDHLRLDVSPRNICAKCHLKKMNEYKGWELQMGVHY
jgi:hypothetical protein